MDYTHELNTEVRSISGGYSLDAELTLEHEGRSVLVVVGNAVVDNACCGFYGCRFALVPGYLLERDYKVNEAGIPVSRVEPIRDEEARKRITVEVQKDTGATQVQFW